MQSLSNLIQPTPVRESLESLPVEQAGEPVKVLLIEDNPGDARLIEIMLFEAGGGLFEPEWVDHLSDGLRRLGETNFGLVLSDLSLPDSQGLETFLQLRARAPSLPIIVLSGLRDSTMAVQAVHEGAQDFLIKGQVDGQLLVRAMRYAIERKRLTEQLGHYAEELRSKNAQLEADFKMAREVQEIFLPQQYPAIPKTAGIAPIGLKFSHCYLPAAAVGGDFFDVFAVGDDAAGVFICDVMGHGMRAALVTAIMRGLVEELMPVAGDPAKFLGELNRSLQTILRRTREPFLATAFYMVVSVTAAEARFASAGHPSPIRAQRSQGRVELLKSCDARHGPALGLFERPIYPAGRCPIAADDLWLLYTDGIFEATDAKEEFGQNRLLAAVRQKLRYPTQRLLDSLTQDVRSFAGAREFEDDVCLVGMDVVRRERSTDVEVG